MKNEEIKLNGKTKEELIILVREAREELSKLRLDKNTGKLKNTRLIFNKRKNLARILTKMNEKGSV